MINVSGHNYSSMAMAGSSIQNKIDTSIQRLSSGQRINAAKDDVAGVQISTRLNAEIKGLEQASRNAADAQSLLDTASAAIKEVKQNVLRIRELAIQAANGTMPSIERASINLEVKENIYSIDSIASNTAWAGETLLDGTFSSMQIQLGSKSNDTLTVNLNSISSAALGLSTTTTTTTTTTSSSSSSTHPGANNSTDVSIIANHPTNSTNPYFIQFTDDTTAGMVHWFSNGGGIDPTDDPNSKVEILGKEYTVSQGTVAAKTANLQAQLAADGVTATVINAGSPWGTLLEVDASTLNDYVTAYGTNSFNLYADPLNVVDGSSNDGDLVSGNAPQLASTHPGANNSTDVSIIANHPTNSTNPYFIQFTDDTTAGMVHWFSNGGGIDPTDDPNSKVEILGKEYTVSQGTVAAKTANLQAQLAADGVTATVINAGSPWGTLLEVDASTLNDYVTAYGTNSFNLYADPLNVVDGSSNDGDLVSGNAPQLASGSGSTTTSTTSTTTTTTPLSLLNAVDAVALISKADSALYKLNTESANTASLSNRLDSVMAVNINTSINLKRAKGLITDANFAQETADLAKNNILQQTSIQMDVLSRKAGDSARTLLNGDSFVYKQNFLY